MADDTIYRQAAIKAIENLQDCYNGFSDTYDKACIIGALEEVPSAQPEIVRCRECKHRTQGVGGFYMCNRLWDQFIDDDFFCADGERRSEDERFD